MKIYKPMLAKTAKNPFSSKDWIFEVKWDGIRAISYVNQDISIRSRNQEELISVFPELQELRNLVHNVVLDGEIIIMKNGKVDFQTLLKRLQATDSNEIEQLQLKNPVLYILFDIIEKNGQSLIGNSLMSRKKILKETIKEGKNVILSDYIKERGEVYFKATQERGLEGIIAKKKNSQYLPGNRSNSWLKIKKINECDCVIFGFTKGTGSREKTFGALILGLYNNQDPVFVGKVGTGFTEKDLESLSKKIKELKVKNKTLQNVEISGEIYWIKPVLVVKIGYQMVTNDIKLRMPRFLGLRQDIRPEECKLDQIKKIDLTEYVRKRDFDMTPEPITSKIGIGKKIFVVQEHDARNLHYDLRLEKDGVLKSWAVPKGIPQKSGLKRLAIQTENHPVDYADFEGTIPEGQYGAGKVEIWDKGTYELEDRKDYKIIMRINGKKLKGRYCLIKLKGQEKNWLFFKC